MSWISVKDRLLDDDQCILMVVQSEMQNVDYDTDEKIGDQYVNQEIAIGYVSDGSLWINYDQDNYYRVSDITHWQPLPEPPKN